MDGTKFYWCKTCGFNNKGCWVSMHKPEDCYRKKKKEENSGKNTEEVAKGNSVLKKMIKGRFLAII